MTRTTVLDLRKINLGATPIFAAAHKTEAVRFAHNHGWQTCDVTPAANRFWKFWVVGQCVGTEDFRLLTKDGGTLDMPYPGRW